MLFDQITSILVPLFLIAASGTLYARLFNPDMTVPNALNMNVFLPALIFAVLVKQDFDVGSLMGLTLGATVIVLVSGLAGWAIARMCGFDPRTLAPPMMFSNSGNLGLPLMTLTFGTVALPAATVVLLVENVLHFTLGSYLLSRGQNPLRNLFSPIILATAAAILFNASGLNLDTRLFDTIEMLGRISIPLMLFSLGTRLIHAELREWKIAVTAGICTPVVGIALAFLVLPWLTLSPMQTGVLILFAVLPPAVLNFLFAERFAQEPEKVASIVVVSHLITLISLPLTLLYVLPRYG
ncbi:MAG: AEC family transporter [Pseudomonadota bacterium]